jgi:hypothetical protein
VISLSHVKRRLGQYGALWLAGFVLALVVILGSMAFGLDLMVAADMALPAAWAGQGLALALGLALTWARGPSLGTSLAVTVLALLLALPLLWAPTSAAVIVAFFADRSIEYSTAYAAFRIGVSQLMYPASEAIFGPGLIQAMWQGFQIAASIVGFLSALANLWPRLRRLLGPEPVES